ncbi:hypothetical protein [Sporosarcina highlanderae]|uniref:Uncharacterized protein n=1 Tax=Sporosarcina highlanderae TaxID=3035916 RepID=A0ABT8JP19_9BACL|nr:hypothetical protein [Sporosarcina highlanderae]MDN4606881.1 hypothetical protein [Sporosarcina highlanderae]
MGYQLPIQPIQSEIYANRMNAGQNNFAYINRTQKVSLNPELMNRFQSHLQQEVIASLEGKGLMVNKYV